MKIEYKTNNKDNQLRAEALVEALFEYKDIKVSEFKGQNTATITCDGSPGFFVFDAETTKHGTIGWRIAAKNIGEAFFNEKPDVIKVGARAQEIYDTNKEKVEDKPVFDKEKYQTNIEDLNGEPLPDLGKEKIKSSKFKDSK